MVYIFFDVFCELVWLLCGEVSDSAKTKMTGWTSRVTDWADRQNGPSDPITIFENICRFSEACFYIINRVICERASIFRKSAYPWGADRNYMVTDKIMFLFHIVENTCIESGSGQRHSDIVLFMAHETSLLCYPGNQKYKHCTNYRPNTLAFESLVAIRCLSRNLVK